MAVKMTVLVLWVVMPSVHITACLTHEHASSGMQNIAEQKMSVWQIHLLLCFDLKPK
jgi:hypothetical protein